MGEADEGRPERRPRRPIAAVGATLAGAVAIVGYSGYWFADALGQYVHCNPPPPNVHCSSFSFWGFSPTFFLLATLVGFVCGGALAILGTVLWSAPHEHTLVGGLILTFSAVSALAYGGYFVGIAAGAAGGILAILHRPPKFRELAPWSGARASPHAGRRSAPLSSRLPPPLSAEAYDPPPPPRRSYSLPALGRPSPGPTSPSLSPSARAVPENPSAYGDLSRTLTGQSPTRPGGNDLRLERPPPPLPKPTGPRASSERASRSSPPALPSGPLPPATSPKPAAPDRPDPGRPNGAPGSEGSRGRSWKCTHCGLTNAPWSGTCTRCQSARPVEG